MKNRLYLVLGVLLVTALGWATWRALRPGPPEPVYGGRPLSYWVAALKTDSWVGAAIYRNYVWPNSPHLIQEHLPAPDFGMSTKVNAMRMLCAMGEAARPAIPALIQFLNGGPADGYAIHALGYVGKGDQAATAAVTGALTHRDRWARFNATNALVQLDPEAAAKAGISLPDFIGCLSNANPQVRRDAALGLGQIGKGNQAAVVALTGALKDKDRNVQMIVASALVRIGKGDSTVVPALVEALKDKDAAVSVYYPTASALWHLDPAAATGAGISAAGFRFLQLEEERGPGEDKSIVAAWTAALCNPLLPIRTAATNALLKLDPDAAARAGVVVPSP
jgi:hypothetical protein